MYIGRAQSAVRLIKGFEGERQIVRIGEGIADVSEYAGRQTVGTVISGSRTAAEGMEESVQHANLKENDCE